MDTHVPRGSAASGEQVIEAAVLGNHVIAKGTMNLGYNRPDQP